MTEVKKKKTKEEKMAEKAKKKAARKAAKIAKKNQPKDHWFSIRGIRKEIKRVVWPSWKTTDKGPGIISVTAEVVIFTAFFALFFVLCNFGITYLLQFIGIGG